MAASNVKSSAQANESEREIIITRTLNAPRELVFAAWTDPKHLKHWWGPQGFTITVDEMHFEPGGVWRFVMHGPDGRDYRNRIVFVEIAWPERIVFRHEPEKGTEPVNHETTVTFEEQGGKTNLTMRMLFPSAAAREYVVKTYKAIEGGNQTLGRLAEYVAKGADESDRELTMTRRFAAPRDVVFKAFTEPERLKRWWGPRGFTNPVCEFDARPGGAIRINMRGPDGVVYPMTGEVKEVKPPERLVFASAAMDEQGNPLLEALNTFTFAETGGETTMTLHVTVTKTVGLGAQYLKGMEQGWSQSLERLEKEVTA
jgi:uncharacterized protein YndB with AHSA1/START domain